MQSILLILMGFNTPDTKDFAKVPPSQFEYDPLIPILRDCGKTYVIKKALKARKISNTEFSILSTNHISKCISEKYAWYKFDITLENQKEDRINAVFTVQYKKKSKKLKVLSYDYSVDENNCQVKNVDKDTNLVEGYKVVPISEYNTLLVMNLIDFGKDYIIKKAIAKGKIPEGDYQSMNIRSVHKKIVENEINYRFCIQIKQTKESRMLEGIFKVNYQPTTGKKTITAYDYRIA